MYDPPLLYNLHTDPGEIYALDPKSTEYADVMTEIQKVKISIVMLKHRCHFCGMGGGAQAPHFSSLIITVLCIIHY